MTGRWLFLAALTIMLSALAAGTVHSGLVLRRWLPPTNLLLTWPDNLLRLGLAGAGLWLGASSWGPGLGAFGWASGSLAGDVLLGLAAGGVMALLLGIGGLLATRHWGAAVYSDRVLQCILPLNGREWAGIVPALFLAAALEELLFRWLPLAGLAWLVAPWWLLWPLALFFGLLHWPQGPWGVLGTMLAAIILSLLFLATGSIWPPLLAHYVMNIVQLVLAKVTGVKPLRGAA